MAQQVVAAANVLFHQFGDEAVILNITNETYYRLDQVALSMWRALTESDSVAAAQSLLLSQYDAPEETLHADLHEFITYLKNANLIDIRD